MEERNLYNKIKELEHENALLKEKCTGIIAQCEWGVMDPFENIDAVFDEWNRY